MRFLILVLLLFPLVHCGGKSEQSIDDAAPPPSDTEENLVVIDSSGREKTEAVRPQMLVIDMNDRSEGEDPPSIDPNREEILHKGSPAERLVSKYELLIERILLEKKENVFNIDRATRFGLVPIAADHHTLLAEGAIDTLLAKEFIELATFVYIRHIHRNDDPAGEKARERIEKIRTMIPGHSTPE